jgi:hypothetical protein
MSAAVVEYLTPAAPRPLIPPRGKPAPYPAAALGPILAPMVEAIVEATQCDVATAAHSTLATATLAAQAHANVETPAGLIRPISLFLLTIAESGERKSAADERALRPVRDVEFDAREPYGRAFRDWKDQAEAIEAERAAIKRKVKGADAKRSALGDLGDPGPPPIRPSRTVEDVTAEGLTKCWIDRHGSLGLFTAEGAKVIAGHGMSPEARLRTAATYSGLWDDGRADRIRAVDGQTILIGRRLAVHLMAQPGVAAGFLGAADLTDQGLISRFLVCRAVEKAGTRFFREPPARGDHRFLTYGEAIGGLLTRRPRTTNIPNELDPRTLPFSVEARAHWIDLHDQIEAKLGPEGELAGVKAFGSKLAENMARLAAVLTLIENPDAAEIEAGIMHRVGALASFYAGEAERLNAEARIEARLVEAETLRAWIVAKWPNDTIRLRDIENGGPHALRPKAIAARAVETLIYHGHLLPDLAARGERFRIIRSEGGA